MGRLAGKWSPSFRSVAERTNLITFDSAPFHGFPRSQDLMRDGTITLLPTPGHVDQQKESITRIRQLRRALPGTIVLPAHDHTAYQFDHVEPFLADGELAAEELRAIEANEADLFDHDWNLETDALPEFVPSSRLGRLVW